MVSDSRLRLSDGFPFCPTILHHLFSNDQKELFFIFCAVFCVYVEDKPHTSYSFVQGSRMIFLSICFPLLDCELPENSQIVLGPSTQHHIDYSILRGIFVVADFLTPTINSLPHHMHKIPPSPSRGRVVPSILLNLVWLMTGLTNREWWRWFLSQFWACFLREMEASDCSLRPLALSAALSGNPDSGVRRLSYMESSCTHSGQMIRWAPAAGSMCDGTV